jgi:hypothetical protein
VIMVQQEWPVGSLLSIPFDSCNYSVYLIHWRRASTSNMTLSAFPLTYNYLCVKNCIMDNLFTGKSYFSSLKYYKSVTFIPHVSFRADQTIN